MCITIMSICACVMLQKACNVIALQIEINVILHILNVVLGWEYFLCVLFCVVYTGAVYTRHVDINGALFMLEALILTVL